MQAPVYTEPARDSREQTGPRPARNRSSVHDFLTSLSLSLSQQHSPQIDASSIRVPVAQIARLLRPHLLQL